MNAPLPKHLLPEILQRETPQALIDALKTRFAERCSTALVVREQHGRDESSFAAPPPAAVVFAESTQDVADAVKLAGQYSVPVIPFGVGTSLEGHLLAVQGGISIDVSRMNRVLAINAGRPDGDGAARRDAQAAQRRNQEHRPVLSRSTPAPTPRWAA